MVFRNSRTNITYSVGPSSGANYMASMKISGKDRVILTVFPDDYSKYSIIYRKKCIIE